MGCCFLHVYRLETWGILLLGCFCWPAVLAVAGLTSLLAAIAAVLLLLLLCTAAADYGGRCWCCYARVSAAVAAAAGPCALPCTALAWTLCDEGAFSDAAAA